MDLVIIWLIYYLVLWDIGTIEDKMHIRNPLIYDHILEYKSDVCVCVCERERERGKNYIYK